MDKRKYYGCEEPEAVSYLEFGSVCRATGEKSIWNYWEDQDAYDLYMFARYSRDLLAFRRFLAEKEKTVEKLNEYIVKSAHNKLMDYIFKYAGLVAAEEKGIVCECGSSLFGWIDEAYACDKVYAGGLYANKIKGFHYIGSDISELMNQGAASFHSDVTMNFSTQGTILGVIEEIKKTFGKRLALFYGLSVSVRYAVRAAKDLVKAAEATDLSIYNRLSMTFDGATMISVYGTGKNIYIISLPELVEELKEKGLHAKYCTENMQYNKDGEHTVRASVVISPERQTLNRFIEIYESCIEKSIQINGVRQGEWRDLKLLISEQDRER